MRTTFTYLSKDDVEHDLELHNRQPATLADLKALLTEQGLADEAGKIFHCGRLLSPEADLISAGLRDGVRVSATRGAPKKDATGLVLQVESGPDSGLSYCLTQGRHVIGRGDVADLQVADTDLSRTHLGVEVGLHSVSVQDLGSTNGTLIGITSVTEAPVPWTTDTAVSAGHSRFTLQANGEPPAAVQADTDGHVLVHRPPRNGVIWRASEHAIPPTAEPSPRPRLSWVAAIIPALVAVVLAVAFKSPQMLAFAAISPLSVLATALTERRSWSRRERARAQKQASAMNSVESEIEAALAVERITRYRLHPGPAEIYQTAMGPDCRLWERQVSSAEFLNVRLGLADQPSQTRRRRDASIEPAGQLDRVPAVVALDVGPLGLTGPRAQQLATARFTVAQLLALHSPNELGLVCLLDDSTEGDWRWLRWSRAHLTAVAFEATDRAELIQELLRIVEDRRHHRSNRDARWSGQWTVLIIDPVDRLITDPGLRELLVHGPGVGVTALCLAPEAKALPSTLPATLELDFAASGTARLTGADRAELEVWADGVRAAWVDEFSRALAPLVDADPTGSELPAEQRLSELVGLTTIDADAISERWRQAPVNDTPIGRAASGPWAIDLVRDGPHILIAGTTGSGKSELLRTIVTGLAADHAPDRLSFVLIDYKGGAAFAECAAFPHVVGMVTDLDANLTRRALVSLTAELQRRERAFAAAGVTDLESFLNSPQAEQAQLSRLVLVIDEFASLAEELPDFLTGLLGIAQRGRSLGVHLILATQRPSGVLSQDIKANMSLRIALRVTDSSESLDVINDERAARISRRTPGRAIARKADGELIEFQTARVNLPSITPSHVELTPLDPWNRRVPISPAVDRETEITQFERAFREAARAHPVPPRPWLDPLPEQVTTKFRPGSLRLELGIIDQPDQQRQESLTLDLEAGGAIAVIGGPRSGRTSTARTIIGAAVSQLTPNSLHLYVLDCAGRGLKPAQQLEHCGTYADTENPARLALLTERLADELTRRQRRIAAAGADTITEARAGGLDIPSVLVVLDGWEAFLAASDEIDSGRTSDHFLRLIRDSAAAGFTFVVTGDRALLAPRTSAVMGRRLLLRLTDEADYALAGLSIHQVPPLTTPGSGVLASTGEQFQLAVLKAESAAAAQWEFLAANARSRIEGVPAAQPIRLQELPDVVRLSTVGSARRGVRLGLGGDEAAPVDCELLSEERHFLIAGPPRSGKSSAVRLIAQQLLETGTDLAVAATRRSSLTDWARERGIEVIGPQARLGRLQAELVIVDDAELFTDTPAGTDLQKTVAAGEIAAVVTARTDDLMITFRGLGVEIRRHRTGILLQPSAVDGELLGARLPRSGFPAVPGRGVLVTRETRSQPAGFVPVQLASV